MNTSRGEPPAVLDPDALEGLRDALGDDELLVDIGETFLREAPSHVTSLASAQEAGDLSALAATAHLIKGSALTFGATRLVALCALLEGSAARGAESVAAVEHEVGEVSRALQDYLGSLA